MASLRSLSRWSIVIVAFLAAACSNPFAADSPREPTATDAAAPTLTTGSGDDTSSSSSQPEVTSDTARSSGVDTDSSSSLVVSRRDLYQSGAYRTEVLTDFRQLSGLAEWTPDAERRLEEAAWQFDDDGEFTFDPPESRAGLFPLIGTWSWDQDVAVFTGSAEVDGVAGVTQTLLYGEFQAEPDGVILIKGTWITTTDAPAEVGRTDFSADEGSAYDFAGSLTASAQSAGEDNDPEPTTIERSEAYAFVSPSGNIVCSMDATTGVTCRIAARSWLPEGLPESCDEGDFDGIVNLTADGASWTCEPDLLPVGRGHELAYNTTAVVGPYRCESQRTGMTCTDSSDRGFFLSRASGDLLSANG